MNLEIKWESILDIVYKTGKIIDLHKYSYYFLKELNQIIPFYAALKLILEGKTNKEVAKNLFISINTVKKHLSHIFNKTKVHNRTELASLIFTVR